MTRVLARAQLLALLLGVLAGVSGGGAPAAAQTPAAPPASPSTSAPASGPVAPPATRTAAPPAAGTIGRPAAGPSSSPGASPIPATDRYLLFMSRGDYLARVGLDGQDYRKLAIDGRVVHFGVAPTMDRLLYVLFEEREVRAAQGDSYKEPVFKLFVSDLVGGSPTLVTDQVGDPNVYAGGDSTSSRFDRCGGMRYPHWSRDGRRILYTGWRESDGAVPFFVYDAVEKKERLLAKIPPRTEVFGIDKPVDELVVKSPLLRRAYQDLPPPRPEQRRPLLLVWYCSDLRWHPDGRSITWSSDSATDRSVFARELDGFDGGDPKSLTSGVRVPFGDEFLWAPNGQVVALVLRFQEGNKGIGHQILLADAKTGKLTRELLRDPANRTVSNIRLLAWSPDSTRLAVYASTVASPQTIRIFDLAAPPDAPPVELKGVGLPAQVTPLEHTQITDFAADGKTFYFPRHAIQNRRVVSSVIESLSLDPKAQPPATPPGAPTGPPAGGGAAAPPASPLPAPVRVYAHADSIRAMQLVAAMPAEFAIPELPLVIPVAQLEGSLKASLVQKKGEVERELAAAKMATANRKAIGGEGETFDSIRFLTKWHTENRGVLESEEKARLAAEEFFGLLAGAWANMTDAERGTVERGLFDRAQALRRYRTVQRGIAREKAGIGTITSGELDTHYTAVSRATWASLELGSLVRMWTPINGARVALEGSQDIYELAEKSPDPKRVAAAEAAQRRHFEALVDTGIAAVLASEIRQEAAFDARKDRLYLLREAWREQKEAETLARSAQNLVVDLASLGFTLFDMAAGLGADVFKGGLYYATGTDWKTRAEKLEAQVMEGWEKTQRKILFLRLLKTKSLAELRALAKALVDVGPAEVGRRVGPPVLALPGAKDDKKDQPPVELLMEDRTFHDATEGGLYRILGVTVVDFVLRSRLELAGAIHETRLVHRDMQAAYRLEHGQDPETGETTWGTILSPTTWLSLGATKLFVSSRAGDWAQRAAQITRKADQMAAMATLEPELVKVEFRFDDLTGDAWRTHAELWDRSGPYVRFVLGVEAEWNGTALHDWRRPMRDVTGDPEAEELKAANEEQHSTFVELDERAERRRMNDLLYEDYVYSWDLPGSLSLAEGLARAKPIDEADEAHAREYAAKAVLLREAVSYDRVKTRAIALFRNVGDIGFTQALFARVGLIKGQAPPSFTRFVWESVNPFAAAVTPDMVQPRAARAVLTQSLTEMAIDLGVPATGEKYEALLNQVMSILIDVGVDVGHAGLEKAAKSLEPLDIKGRVTRAVQAERARFAELDAERYTAELLDRAIVRATDTLASLGRAYAAARDPAVRASIARQSADVRRRLADWMAASAAVRHMKELRESLANALKDPAEARAKLAAAARTVKALILPPTRSWYERALRIRPEDFFDAAKGLDIEKLRKDFKTMRRLLKPEERPALDALEARIDAARDARFLLAMGDFLRTFHGQIDGVILNGTVRGNPEYKGIFSDRDFTVLVPEGTSIPRIREGLNASFEKHGIVLNEKGKPPSADIEGMIQTFLPGDVRPIKSRDQLHRWLTDLAKNPTRYLSGGGSRWVGLYNYLSGGTLSLSGGSAVVDGVPNPALLPKPDMLPILSHGLVLDAMRFDKIKPVGEIPNAATMAELLGARAKQVLRAVDGLIWALDPALLEARTRADAQAKGYHRLVLDDAQRLGAEKLLSAQDLADIHLLADLKAGNTVYQALKIKRRDVEGRRGQLEALWQRLDGLVQRAYRESRRVHLEQLRTFANGEGNNPAVQELLATLAFLNWDAARRVDPQALRLMSGRNDPDIIAALKLEDQTVIGLGRVLDTPTQDPALAIRDLDDHPRLVRRDEHPADGADPDLGTTPVAAGGPGGPPRPPRPFKIEEIFEPSDLKAYLIKTNKAYLDGELVGYVKTDAFEGSLEMVNEVVAYRLGRLLDVNIPYCERMITAKGETVAVMRRARGDILTLALKGVDADGQPWLPRGSTEALKEAVREQFIRDRLLSSLLGDYDRKGNNFIVTPDGQLVAIDHANATPFEAGLAGVEGARKRDTVAEAMRRRFEGLDTPEPGMSTRRYRDLDKELGVSLVDVLHAWKEMRGKLVDAEGELTKDGEAALKGLADYYGADSPKVLETWKVRIGEMERVVLDVFGAELRAKYDLTAQEDTGQPILFGQIGVSPRFSSGGLFKGASIDEVAAKLRSGEMSPDDLPVQYIWVNGQKVVVNNRSLTTLSKAGMKPTITNDMTGKLPLDGPDSLESVLLRLEEMDSKPSRTMPIRSRDGDRTAPPSEIVALPDD